MQGTDWFNQIRRLTSFLPWRNTFAVTISPLEMSYIGRGDAVRYSRSKAQCTTSVLANDELSLLHNLVLRVRCYPFPNEMHWHRLKHEGYDYRVLIEKNTL